MFDIFLSIQLLLTSCMSNYEVQILCFRSPQNKICDSLLMGDMPGNCLVVNEKSVVVFLKDVKILQFTFKMLFAFPNDFDLVASVMMVKGDVQLFEKSKTSKEESFNPGQPRPPFLVMVQRYLVTWLYNFCEAILSAVQEFLTTRLINPCKISC